VLNGALQYADFLVTLLMQEHQRKENPPTAEEWKRKFLTETKVSIHGSCTALRKLMGWWCRAGQPGTWQAIAGASSTTKWN
jgi:hypothetical protein